VCSESRRWKHLGQGYVEGWVGFGIVSIESLVSASRDLAVHQTFSVSQILCLKTL